jgi:predicted DNA-binding protein
MPKQIKVAQSAIDGASETLSELPPTTPGVKRKRKAHKRPNARPTEKSLANLTWAEDTVPGAPRPQLNTRVSAEVLQWYNDRAENMGKERPVIVRQALEWYMQVHDDPNLAAKVEKLIKES